MARNRTVVSRGDIAVEEDGVERAGSYTEYSDGTVTVISDDGREKSTQVGNSDAASVAKTHLRLLVSSFVTGRIEPLKPPKD